MNLKFIKNLQQLDNVCADCVTVGNTDFKFKLLKPSIIDKVRKKLETQFPESELSSDLSGDKSPEILNKFFVYSMIYSLHSIGDAVVSDDLDDIVLMKDVYGDDSYGEQETTLFDVLHFTIVDLPNDHLTVLLKFFIENVMKLKDKVVKNYEIDSNSPTFNYEEEMKTLKNTQDEFIEKTLGNGAVTSSPAESGTLDTTNLDQSISTPKIKRK